MKKLLFTILATTMLIATALQSAEIIPVWNKESGAGDIQDIEFLKGQNEFVLLVGVGSNAQLQVRTTETGELINTVPVGTSTNSRLAITPDSTQIIHLNGGIAQVRNIAENLSVEGVFGVDSDTIIYGFTDIAIDPIRPLAYVTVYGWKGAHPNITTKSKVSVYNYITHEFVQDLTELGDYEYSVIEVSEDGKYLAALNDGKTYLKVWNIETMELNVNEKLYIDNQEFPCQSKDIKFSSIINDQIYISGLFSKQAMEKRHSGVFTYNMVNNSRERIVSDAIYSGNQISFLDNETRIFNSSRTRIGVLNLLNSDLEWYGVPPEFVFSQKVIHSVNSNYFIGITANNISKFLYDSQSNIEDNIEEEIIISPNPTTNRLNINLNSDGFEYTRLSIVDILGNEVGLIEEGLLNTSNYQKEYDVSDLPPSIYFIRLEIGNEVVTKQFIKE